METKAKGAIQQSQGISRRKLLQTTAATAAAGLAAPYLGPVSARAADGYEIVHWSWLSASDGEIWAQMIDNFNEAHKDKGVQIRIELVPYDQYTTKVLAATATGRAPDFGWGTAGTGAALARDGVTVALDDLVGEVGLDIDDFDPKSIKAARYPKYGNSIYMIPMDLMSLQPEINLDHVAEAGLDPDSPPATGEDLIEWGLAMTKHDGDTVTRSGILMTGSGVQPTVTWGIVAEQMGFQRASEDLSTAAVNPEKGIAAMEWVLDLFDTHRVSTRDVTDRYKAFGTGGGSIFWTGPWTLNGYVGQGLNFMTSLFPNIGGEQRTYFEMGGLELYAQSDPGSYKATLEAVKWLSANSFLWTTVGRGASPLQSILNRPDYRTSGHSWYVRGAFVDGMAFATIPEVPVLAGPDFTIYSGGNFLARTLEGVWAGSKSPAQAMDQLAEKWQEGLDAG